ncbi:unnamed protein product [Heterobilharzia americana]|nr:unnamed protein product [Heterobilharzia americana]
MDININERRQKCCSLFSHRKEWILVKASKQTTLKILNPCVCDRFDTHRNTFTIDFKENYSFIFISLNIY